MNYNTNWIQAKSFYIERKVKEPTTKYRNNFQKDRDRILYSKSFRRLSGKTQVFLAGQNDHLRTRLTHTLEVNQIARTISNALNLNPDLTEAIALGHDIGHTPFGHIGERTLNFIMNGCEEIKDFNTDLKAIEKGFKHNVQALRILNDLERSKENLNGLNLTNYTLWGIVNHTKKGNKDCERTEMKSVDKEVKECYFGRTLKPCSQAGILHLDFYKKYLKSIPDDISWTFEALVVRISDEIAQRHHDIEDGILTGLIQKDEVIRMIEDKFSSFIKNPRIDTSLKELNELKNEEFLTSYISRFIINSLVQQIILDSRINIIGLLKKYKIKSSNDFVLLKKEIYKNEDIFNLINYNSDFEKEDAEIQKYLKNKILNSYIAQKMDGKAEYIIRKLFEAFVANPQQLPDRTLMYFFNSFFGKEKMKSKIKEYSEKNLIGGLRAELKNNFERNSNPKYKHALLRTICDYISGMTDNYAYNQYELLYGSIRISQQ